MIQSDFVDPRWRTLYKLGGVSALVIAVLLIGEIFVYAIVPNPSTPAEHFELFRNNALVGLLFFDLLGMACYLFFIPFILSLYLLLRQYW